MWDWYVLSKLTCWAKESCDSLVKRGRVLLECKSSSLDVHYAVMTKGKVCVMEVRNEAKVMYVF